MNSNIIRKRRTWAIHLTTLLPGVLLLGDWLSGNLSVNPIQEAIQRSGRIAITLLLVTLAIRPLAQWLKRNWLLNHRRTLGLYTFAYALLHATLFFGIDYALQAALILQEFAAKPYLWLGVGAFCILLPLAITSFRYWMRKLGKNWKRLHRLIYLAAVLAVLHYGLAVKGDFFALRGEILRPWLYGAGVAGLLGIRLFGYLRNQRKRFPRQPA